MFVSISNDGPSASGDNLGFANWLSGSDRFEVGHASGHYGDSCGVGDCGASGSWDSGGSSGGGDFGGGGGGFGGGGGGGDSGGSN